MLTGLKYSEGRSITVNSELQSKCEFGSWLLHPKSDGNGSICPRCLERAGHHHFKGVPLFPSSVDEPISGSYDSRLDHKAYMGVVRSLFVCT